MEEMRREKKWNGKEREGWVNEEGEQEKKKREEREHLGE